MPDVPKLAWIVVEHMAARGGNPLCTISLSTKKRLGIAVGEVESDV